MLKLEQRYQTISQPLDQIQNSIQGLETDVKQIAQREPPQPSMATLSQHSSVSTLTITVFTTHVF